MDKLIASRRQVLGGILAAVPAALLGSRYAFAGSGIAAAPGSNPGIRNVLDFGAVPNDPSHAVQNVVAFRAALCSYIEDFNRLPFGVSVYVPAGQFFLSDGITVPPGCSLIGAGMGASQLINQLPVAPFNDTALVTVNAVIVAARNDVSPPKIKSGWNDVGNPAKSLPDDALSLWTHGNIQPCLATPWGAGLPATTIQDLYVISRSNACVDLMGVTLFAKNLWVQSGFIGIRAIGGDGVIQGVIVDSDTFVGLHMHSTGNYVVNGLYSFLVKTGLSFSGLCTNTRLSDIVIGLPQVSGIRVNPGSAVRAVVISGIALTQNDANSATYAGCIQIQGRDVKLVISDSTFSNYSGFAVRTAGNTVENTHLTLVNCTFDGYAVNAAWNLNVASGSFGSGIDATGIGRLELNACRFLNLRGPAIFRGQAVSNNTIICDGAVFYWDNYCPGHLDMSSFWTTVISGHCPIQIVPTKSFTTKLRLSNLVCDTYNILAPSDRILILNYLGTGEVNGDQLMDSRFSNCVTDRPGTDIRYLSRAAISDLPSGTRIQRS